MKKKHIAIIIATPPHGTAKGREALDMALACSLIHDVSLFFVGEGAFHLLANQKPEQILVRDYIATFGVLELYDINNYFIVVNEHTQAILQNQNLVIETKTITSKTFNQLLKTQDVIFNF